LGHPVNCICIFNASHRFSQAYAWDDIMPSLMPSPSCRDGTWQHVVSI